MYQQNRRNHNNHGPVPPPFPNGPNHNPPNINFQNKYNNEPGQNNYYGNNNPDVHVSANYNFKRNQYDQINNFYDHQPPTNYQQKNMNPMNNNNHNNRFDMNQASKPPAPPIHQNNMQPMPHYHNSFNNNRGPDSNRFQTDQFNSNNVLPPRNPMPPSDIANVILISLFF